MRSSSRQTHTSISPSIMVVSHRESSISSNIRAIIEQLNLSPVERIERLIDRTKQENTRCKSYPDVVGSPPKISIGVYDCKSRNGDFEMPSPMKPGRKIEERSLQTEVVRPRFPTQGKKEQLRMEHANEVNVELS